MQENKRLFEHINSSWDELTVQIKEDTETHLGVPNPFVAPSVHRTDGFVFRDQFYWDTYFTVLALLKSNKKKLAFGMVDNLLFLLEKLSYVPNSNNRIHLGRSQPPLLSSMVLEVYKYKENKQWLTNAYNLVKQEYKNVWTSKTHPHDRLTETGLSRYYHQDKTHRGAEDESGWDYTTRFDSRALDFVPIDLNCFLYLYERNLAEIGNELGFEQESIDWSMKADLRKELINNLLWNDDVGTFFDYDYVNSKGSKILSLATFLPLFVGIASNEQAKSVVSNLKEFNTENGLTTTSKKDVKMDGKQWASPNGWAPLHYFVVESLLSYGFEEEANAIANKWIQTVNDKFNKTGRIFEKYNVLNVDEDPAHAVYPDQIGFAWTNAVTYLLSRDT